MPRRVLRMGLVVAVSLAATACMSPGPPSRHPGPRVGPVAGMAEPLPGLAALLPRGAAIFTSYLSPVSCSGPGDCTAIGTVSYDIAGKPGPQLAFVADARGGAWQPARLLPGLADTTGNGPTSGIEGLSCSSPGNCTAVGDTFAKVPTERQIFITVEKGGTWGMPAPAPGVSRLSANASVPRISCGPAGNCLIAGVIDPTSSPSSGERVFALAESGGRWGSAAAIPGLPATGGSEVTVNGVACGPSGACAVAGVISSASPGTDDGFIATETAGKWRAPALFPRIAIQAIACAAGGNCTAVGQATGRTSSGFAVAGHDGTWSVPVPLPGMAGVTSLSCSAAGTCTAVGTAALHPGDQAVGAAVTTEDGGTWEPARLLDTRRLPGAQPGQPPAPGLTGPLVNSQLTSVSCTPTGACLAAGFYNGPPNFLGANSKEAFLAFRKSGTWSAAGTIPGLPALDGARGSGVTALAYAGAGHWALTGTYDAGGTKDAIQSYLGDDEPFVAMIPAA